MNDAQRWREARRRYIALGLHPKVAGFLALAVLDGRPMPESLDDAYRTVSGQPEKPPPTPRRARPAPDAE